MKLIYQIAALIILLAAIFLVFKGCNGKPDVITTTDTITTVKLIYKDTGRVVIKKIPVIVKSEPDTVWKTMPIDSAKVVSEFNTRNSFSLDTSANEVNVKIRGVIFQNILEAFNLTFNNTRPVKEETKKVTNNTTVQPKLYKYSLGAQTIGNNEGMDFFVTGSYRVKRISYKVGIEPFGEDKKGLAGIEFNF